MKKYIPADEEFGNFFPFVAVLPMCLENDHFFLLAPAFLVNEGVEMIVPSALN